MNTIKVNWLGTTADDKVTIGRFMQAYHYHRGERETRAEARNHATEYIRQTGDARAVRVVELVIDDRMLP